MGDSDFWVNNAKMQPGCLDHLKPDDLTLADVIEEIMSSCSHLRTPRVYIETINPTADCSFPYCPCDSLASFQAGNCKSCDAAVGAQLGYKANLSPNRGDFYGVTTKKAPYCVKTSD